LNIRRKAFSIGTSAALLASLLTAIAAPSAFAAAGSTSVTGPVSIGPGSTSASAITLNFTEGTSAAPTFNYPGGGFTATIQLYDSAGGNTISFSGTPALSGAPGSLVSASGFPQLAASAVITDQLKLSFTSTDTGAPEPFSITGLKIKAASGAPAGAIRMIVTLVTGVANVSAWGNGNLTVAATLTALNAAGSTVHALSGADPTVAFGVSGAVTVNGIAGTNGLLVVDDGAATESQGITAGTFGPPTTSVTTNPFGFSHAAATDVSQNVVVAGLLASPGAIVNGLIVNTTFGAGEFAATAVQPGENNQGIGGIDVKENATGTLTVGTVITFTLDTAGVKFSSSPLLHVHNGLNLGNGASTNTACSLSFSRTSCSVTVTAKSTSSAIPVIVLSTTESSQAFVDLDASVPQGTTIGINVSTSPALPVKVTDNAVAMVSRVIIGVGATPTIYINENDQQSGMLTLTESVAGQFKDASDVTGQNWFGLCQLTGETYTRAPYAVVTAGDLKLRSGAAAATSVLGTLFTGPASIYSPFALTSCVKWQVWSKSTVASTIELRGSDVGGVVLPSGANNGPRLSVPGTLVPGTTQTQVNVGTEAEVNANTVKQTIATNAVRAYRNQPVVAAVSQPIVPKGSANSLLGNLTITETQAGQFKAGETITVTILPRSSIGVAFQARQDIFLKTGTTADTPVIGTNSASGLLTGSAAVGTTAFTFAITQQATGTLGVITISNIHVITLADAIDGSILVRVTSAVAGQGIDQSVVNGTIGTIGVGIPGFAQSRLGATQLGSFTIATKVQKVGKYVTFRFDFGVAAAGKTFEIWGATKTGNDWSAFTKVTARVANASGVVYYYIRQGSATWKSYRAFWSEGGRWTPARQARWIP
jgi:hypothetical protein